MVTRSLAPCQTARWRQDLVEAYRDVDDLLGALGLSRAAIPDLDPDARDFRLLVPLGFAALMRPGDPHDPLLRQVLPLRSEQQPQPGFSRDPVGDAAADRGDGLLKKYQGRMLWMPTRACAIHCRYCFRRHLPALPPGQSPDRISATLDRIAADPGISEVILSGGDPLMLDDPALAELMRCLDRIAHVKRLRIHTRLPVVLPSRVTESLRDLLAGVRPRLVMVIHANHANELGTDSEQALRRLTSSGIHLLSQSVLLRGVNDSPSRLCALSERLFECGVLPYYLHQLDPVQGAAHFAVPDGEAIGLESSLRQRLPGYLVPRLVREIPGAGAKMPLIDLGQRSVTPA